MDRLCMEYMQLLSGDGAPSERFWQLYERIMADKRSSGVQLRLSRSKLLESILWLIDDGVITVEDLEDFSDELKETVNTCMAIRRWEDPDEEQLPNRPTE